MGSDTRITGLQCEYQKQPMLVQAERIRLSWRIESSSRAVSQSSFRVLVYREKEKEAVLYDSAWVTSSTPCHTLPMKQLPAGAGRFFWEVQLWIDVQGVNEQLCSSPSWFETALPPDSWQSPFIRREGVLEPSRPFYLRREFSLPSKRGALRLYATALGLYELFINGRRVSDELFAPGWTSYHNRLLYQVYDVTEFLVEGENVIGAMVGHGWYAGELAWKKDRGFYGSEPALSLRLDEWTASGSATLLETDLSWQSSYGPLEYAELYHGCRFDARNTLGRWTECGYDLKGWEAVSPVPCSDRIVPQDGPPVRLIERLPVQRVITTPKGERVFDFGQNLTGWVEFSVEGKRVDVIVLEHAEVLDEKGCFYTGNMRGAKNRVEYVCGGEKESFSPGFCFQGFRYVRIESELQELSPSDFTACVIHSDWSPTLSFSCSHELLNQLHHNILWGWKGNSLDVPTDCSQRDERLGWTGDAQIFIPTAAYLSGCNLFFRKWLSDLAADQLPSGGVPFVIPDILTELLKGDPMFTLTHSSSGWGDAAVVCPWTCYEFFDDQELLADQYESMCAWVEYMAREAGPGLVWESGFHFGDWVALDAHEGSYFGATPVELVATAYFAYSTSLVARAARILDMREDALKYEARVEKIRKAFLSRFFTPEGTLTARTQTACVLALVLDLVPPGSHSRCAEELVALIEETGGHLTTGFIGTPWLLDALSRHGKWAEAYSLLLRTEYPSWLYQVTKGATTIWEHWDGIREDGSFWSEDMNSFNHYSYGAVGHWMYENIGGLSLLEPGWKRASYAPVPHDPIDQAAICYESIYGTHRLEWKKEGSSFFMEFTVPACTQAEVILPEGITRISFSDGLSFTLRDSRLQATAPSGTYRIEGSW